MLRKISLATLALGLWLNTGSAFAQTPCSVGVYTEPDGTGNFIPSYFEGIAEFDVYVVAFAEDVMSAIAYSLTIPDPTTTFIVGEVFGPSGNGVNVPDVPGYLANNVGLGECAIGFGGQPILVAAYRMVMISDFPYGEICVAPNPFRTETDPNQCQYSTCDDELKPCALGPCVFLDIVDPTESISFGAVKALY